MPKIRASAITTNYDAQGDGEPRVLIPYLAADYCSHAPLYENVAAFNARTLALLEQHR
ncbi:MAG: hypothetical protein ACM3JC_09260 [Rudaea sp.]